MGDRRKCQTYTASPAEPGVSRLLGYKFKREPEVVSSFAAIDCGRELRHRLVSGVGRGIELQ